MLSIVVDVKTLTGAVQNEGHGGDNWIHNDAVRAAVNVYAATLPPLAFGSNDYDLLISEMVGDAIAAHDVKKRLSKAVLVLKPDGHVYGLRMNKRPVAEVIAAVQKYEPTWRVLNTMPFAEALAVYKAAVAS
jgi:hypothetical protein